VAFINSGEYYMPPLLPKVDGICDSCGTPSLVQRHDDTPEVVQQRWALCFGGDFTSAVASNATGASHAAWRSTMTRPRRSSTSTPTSVRLGRRELRPCAYSDESDRNNMSNGRLSADVRGQEGSRRPGQARGPHQVVAARVDRPTARHLERCCRSSLRPPTALKFMQRV
jgi:hypothetical protein